MHGANLILELKQQMPNLELRGWGGEKMQNAGMQLVKHYRETSFMGFVEVLKNIRTIKKLFAFCKKDIETWKPDKVVLIDYPGFNLRMMPFLKELEVEITYYISPQVWAWKANRAQKIKKYVDKLLVILPFEEKWYLDRNIKATFVGHPLYDEIDQYNFENIERKKIALLPGSRVQEIEKMLPLYLQMAKQFKAERCEIAALSIHGNHFYERFQPPQNVKLRFDKTYELLAESKAAIVTSGTATLETAVFNVPQVVCYKSSWLNYQIAKRLIKVKYISLVNLIANQELVKELIQADCNNVNLKKELESLLEIKAKDFYAGLNITSNSGKASFNAAKKILKF